MCYLLVGTLTFQVQPGGSNARSYTLVEYYVRVGVMELLHDFLMLGVNRIRSVWFNEHFGNLVVRKPPETYETFCEYGPVYGDN